MGTVAFAVGPGGIECELGGRFSGGGLRAVEAARLGQAVGDLAAPTVWAVWRGDDPAVYALTVRSWPVGAGGAGVGGGKRDLWVAADTRQAAGSV